MRVFLFVAATCAENLADTLVLRLGSEDRQRIAGIGSLKRRSEFVSGRLLVRQALLGHYGEQSEAWHLRIRPGGSLLLEAADAAFGQLAISLSHSHGRVVCAFAETADLGVDIEFARPRHHLDEMARFALHPCELNEFSRLDVAGKTSFFYAKWVLKEALGKALGHGIAYPMSQFHVHAGRVLAAPPEWLQAPEQWHLSDVVLDSGHHVGLAWQGHATEAVSIQTIELEL